MILTGHAAVFNSRSVDLGGFREVIAPGAFARTIRNGHAIHALHSHDYADLLGSTRSGALKLSEDSHGLYFELELADTSLGRDVYALVKRGDMNSMSFLFNVNGTAGERWRELPDGTFERTLIDVNLFEISTVASPAYPGTRVSARAVEQSKQSIQSVHNRMTQRYMRARLAAA